MVPSFLLFLFGVTMLLLPKSCGFRSLEPGRGQPTSCWALGGRWKLILICTRFIRIASECDGGHRSGGLGVRPRAVSLQSPRLTGLTVCVTYTSCCRQPVGATGAVQSVVTAVLGAQETQSGGHRARFVSSELLHTAGQIILANVLQRVGGSKGTSRAPTVWPLFSGYCREGLWRRGRFGKHGSCPVTSATSRGKRTPSLGSWWLSSF